MRIILVIESLGSGGAERQLVGLASLLKDRDYDVVVVSYIKQQFYEEYLRERGIKYILETNLQNKVLRPFRMALLFRKLKADVVISYLTHVNQFVCLSRLFYRFKLIVSERSLTEFGTIKARIPIRLYNFAEYVVPNSVTEANNIISHFPNLKNKIIPIPNFIKTEVFCPSSNKHVSKDYHINLLCVGRFDENKNAIPLIEAVSVLVNKGYKLRLKWIGNMRDEEYVNKVRKKITDLHLEKIVTLQNQTVNVISEYQDADVFCFPSLLEGYPNVIIEAMSCGLPIVCSNVCEMPLIVKEGVNGFLFNPHDICSIVSAISKVIEMTPQQREEIGRANRDYVIKNNSPEVFVQNYIKLL